jgi:hypothetical protein
MAETERGSYRFSVKETGRGTFFLAAEPASDTLKGLSMACWGLTSRKHDL